MHPLRSTASLRAGLALTLAVAAFLLGRLYARSEGAPTTETLAIEGTLLDTAGLPLPGLWNMTLRVFDPDSDGGLATRTCEFPGTTVAADGRFMIPMNAGTPCVEVFRTSRQTAVELTANNGRGSTVTTARTRVHAVPYALEADRAAQASSAVGALDTRLDNEHRAVFSRFDANRVTRAYITQRGDSISMTYGENVASVTRLAAGNFRVNFRCPFVGPRYVVSLSSTNGGTILKWDANTASSVVVLASAIRLSGGAVVFQNQTEDLDIHFLAIGELLTTPPCSP